MNDYADILRAAADELLATPVSPAFRAKSKIAGAVCDLKILFAYGWTLASPVSRSGEFFLCRGSIWIAKALRREDDDTRYVLEVACGLPMVPNGVDERTKRQIWKIAPPEAVGRMLSGSGPMTVFIRSLRLFAVSPDGLRRTRIDRSGDPALVESLLVRPISEIAEAAEQFRPPFPADLAYQTASFDVSIPPDRGNTPFNRAIATLAEVARRAHGEERPDAAERLVLPLVECAGEPEKAGELREELEETTFVEALIVLLVIWQQAEGEDEDGGSRLLGFILRRLPHMAPEPEAAHLQTLAGLALSHGQRLAACALASLAVQADPAAKDTAHELMVMLLIAIAHAIRHAPQEVRDDSSKPIPGFGELVQMLVRHQDVLKNCPNYWSLVGLAFLEKGESAEFVMDTLYRGIPKRKKPTRNGDRDESTHREQHESCAMRDPLAWQCAMIGLFEAKTMAREQMVCFPTPISESEYKRQMPASTLIAGLSRGDIWAGIVPGIGELAGALEREVVALGSSDGCLRTNLLPFEVIDTLPLCETWVHELDSEKFREEILPVAVIGSNRTDTPPALSGQKPGKKPTRGKNGDDDGKDSATVLAILPLPNPHRAEGPNFRNATVWQLFPYVSQFAGEARFLFEDGEHELYAFLPFFASDRHYIFRGQPQNGYLYAVPAGTIKHAKSKPSKDDPRRGTFPPRLRRLRFHRYDIPVTRSLYDFVGSVVSVQKATVHGAEPVHKILLDVGDRMPIRIPLYVHPSAIKTCGEILPGDHLHGVFVVCADLLPPETPFKQWLDEHPDGVGAEPGKDESQFVPPPIFRFRKAVPSPDKEEDNGDPLNEIDEDISDVLFIKPENFNYLKAAEVYLRLLLGDDNCERREEPADGAQLLVRVDGIVRRYHVEMCQDRNAPKDVVARGVERIVVRVVEHSDHYAVEYEGMPLRMPDKWNELYRKYRNKH